MRKSQVLSCVAQLARTNSTHIEKNIVFLMMNHPFNHPYWRDQSVFNSCIYTLSFPRRRESTSLRHCGDDGHAST